MTFMGGIEPPRTKHPGYRAEQVLAFLLRHYAEHRSLPSYEQIMVATGIGSCAEISRIVGSLERRGLVRRVGLRLVVRQTAKSQRGNPVINGCPT